MRALVFLQTSFDIDGLIHQGGEISKVVHYKCKLDVSLKAVTELLLSTCISSNVFFSIAGQVQKLSLISFNSFVALDEAAELTLLPVHDSLRNEAGTESSLEVWPGDDCSNWQSTPVAIPPLSRGSLQEEGSKRDIAGKGYISRLHLIGDVTEPVISVQRLS